MTSEIEQQPHGRDAWLAHPPEPGAGGTTLPRTNQARDVLPAPSAVWEAAVQVIHGGLSPGAPYGPDNGMWKHGLRSRAAVEERRMTTALIREYRRILRELGTDKPVI